MLRFMLIRNMTLFHTLSVFVLSAFIFSDATTNEPICSKFQYEEQLLGKMVRFEAKMEKWDEDLRRFEETMLSILDRRRQEMKKSLDQQNEQLEKVSKENKKIQETLRSHTTERSDAPMISFNAYTATGGSYPENGVIKFPHVILNEGEGYNATTGYFTASLSGLYLFTAHACHQPNKYMVFSIVKGNSTIALSTVYENSSVTCGTAVAPVKLEVGDKVCVQSPYTASQMFTNIHRWPSFTGVLLHGIQRKA
ncbi:complement C1q and tumor necrosis factor-related protein 9-like [Mercenaria mercenaria]|uniref:complement C1q and tumor necrosis factor-related protein 9-like n=1 Tax=Mercenaria mercenaria TaxID=6596 RepID=UPI00234EE63B|nr:complement C1q and tumor necrosis factor-related protein 9-like [Mercenaria mercenaria]